ncbi:EamA domain-containing membrane protein RarD [Ancylobacter aquaticus]|uniref:EamA domain-containing membrane protein RarD n=1 Tax=Ancylobacter aquaticus TaxID=100 RepID=A0A4R1I2A6_ANCAQ|nr:DMT family transporter [Ancylobacter aquaticus]TCK28908.1 EamA domain-containing membrane protein RarD [Ancylobacter aquaticus]
MSRSGDAASHPPVPLAGYAFGAAGAILFASKGIIIKLAYAEGIDPETLLALRMAFSLPFYLAIGAFALLRLRGMAEPLPSGRLVVQSMLVGALGYWLASYLDFAGLQYTSASFSRLILFTYPIYVALFGALLFSQPIRPKAMLAFAICYGGLALIFLQNVSAMGSDVVKGSALVTLAAISFALYQLCARSLLQRVGSALFTCIAMISASIMAIGQFAVMRPVEALMVSRHGLMLAVLVAIAATVLPTFLMNAALKRISAQANSMISTVSPVATMVLAMLFLGETASVAELAGAALVMTSIGWFTLSDARRR